MERQAIDSLGPSEQQSCNHVRLRDIELFDVNMAMLKDSSLLELMIAVHSLVSQLPSTVSIEANDNNDLITYVLCHHSPAPWTRPQHPHSRSPPLIIRMTCIRYRHDIVVW